MSHEFSWHIQQSHFKASLAACYWCCHWHHLTSLISWKIGCMSENMVSLNPPLTPFKSQVAHAEPKPGAPPTRGRQHHVTAVPWRCHGDGHGTCQLKCIYFSLFLNHTRLQLVHCIPGFPILPFQFHFLQETSTVNKNGSDVSISLFPARIWTLWSGQPAMQKPAMINPVDLGCGTLFSNEPIQQLELFITPPSSS